MTTTPETEPKFQLSLVVVVFVLPLVVAVVVSALLFVTHLKDTAMNIEYRGHALKLVCAVVLEFIDKEERWPASWEELESVSVKDAGSMFVWPEDSERVKELIDIDFAASLSSVAKQGANDFDAIKPNGGHFSCEYEIQQVVDRASNVNQMQESLLTK